MNLRKNKADRRIKAFLIVPLVISLLFLPPAIVLAGEEADPPEEEIQDPSAGEEADPSEEEIQDPSAGEEADPPEEESQDPSAGEETELPTGNQVSVIGCSVANGSTVPSTAFFTFAFTNNVVNTEVRENNKDKFMLEDASGSALAVSVVMADDQTEPDLKRMITVVPANELVPGSYQLTARAGIKAKNGTSTLDDFVVRFSVEGSEPEEGADQEHEPGSDQGEETTPGSEPGTEPVPGQDQKPEPGSDQPSGGEQGGSGSKPSAGTEDATGSDGTEAGAEPSPGSEETNQENAMQLSETAGSADQEVLQDSADLLSADAENVQRYAMAEEKPVQKEEAAEAYKVSGSTADFQGESSDGQRLAVVQISLGKSEGKLRMLPKQTAAANMPEAGRGKGDGAYGHAGRSFASVLTVLFCAGAIRRVIKFKRELTG